MRYFKIIFLMLTIQCFAWETNFEEAEKLAQSQDRPLLIAFLGPNWCPCSDQLEEEVLNSEPFLAALKDQVIFLKVEIQEDYEENFLAEKYRIESCPSLVLIESDGHEIAVLDYLPLGGQEFGCYINEMLANYYLVEDLTQKKSLCNLQLDELKSLYTQAGKFADTTFKQALLEEGLKVDQGPYFLLQQYGHLLAENGVQNRKAKVLRNKIIARDIDNEQGYRRQIALMDFETLANARLGTKAVVKPLIDYLRKFGTVDTENAWEIEMKISKYLFSKDQIEEALKHANASLKVAPESARNEIAKSVEYLKTLKNKIT